MAQLRQFDLQLAFVGARALGKDIQDKGGAVQYPALTAILDIALLNGAQRPAHKHQVSLVLLDLFGQFIDFSTTHEITRIGPVPRCRQQCNNLYARRVCKFIEFIKCVRTGTGKTGVQDDRAFTALLPVKQGAAYSSSSSSKTLTFRAGTMVDMACL